MKEIKTIISILGVEGSGKTSILAGLSWLGAVGNQSDFCVVAEGTSRLYLIELLKSLKNGTPPNPTSEPETVSFDVIHKGVRYQLGMQDIPGKSIKHQVSKLDPIFARIKGSDILFVVLDAQRDVCDSEGSERLEAVLHILEREDISGPRKQIAVIFAKADLLGYSKSTPEMDPRLFLEQRNPVLFKKFESLKLAPSYFFLSSLGSDMKEGQIPEPVGYEPIFKWVSLVERKRQIVNFAVGAFKEFRDNWSEHVLGLIVLFLSLLIFITAGDQKARRFMIVAGNAENLVELTDNDTVKDLPDGVYRADQLSRIGGRVATKARDAGTPFIIKKTWTSENGSKIDSYYAVGEDPKNPGNPIRDRKGRVLAENNGKAIYSVADETSALIDNTWDVARQFVKKLFCNQKDRK